MIVWGQKWFRDHASWFSLLANKAWAIGHCLTEGTRVASLETSPVNFPQGGACAPRSPEPDGHMPGCLCHLPSMAHTCSADEDASPEGGTGHDPREASVDRAVLPLAPFLGFRVKKVHPTKKGWNSTSFLKTECPSQASVGGSNSVIFSMCFVSVERFQKALEVLSLKSVLIGEVSPLSLFFFFWWWGSLAGSSADPASTRVDPLSLAGHLLTSAHLQDQYFQQKSPHCRYTTMSHFFFFP